MALEAGTRLGTYEIAGPIGAGGMGEVYRATDTKLGREVAIKTLPAALSGDADRLARFEREATLLAALNHPHIATIYGLDEHEGMQYLAMELVEGETLEQKLKGGALPIEDALRLALQIAEALEAAHEKGVVHRDLKPANVMVTADGAVKVLDFGLAKAFLNEPEGGTAANSPSLSLAMTQQGLVLGTAGYMSPEQASGQATDQRADVWAFGVVLYEMLTGLPLFSGESVPHILADVLKSEPDWERLPGDLHPRLRLMLERCLRKRPRERYHSMADARIDIEDVLNTPETAVPQVAMSAAAARQPTHRGLTFAALVFVVGGAITGLAAWNLKPVPPEAPRPVIRMTEQLPNNQAVARFGRPGLALSPNGRHLVFNTIEALYLRTLEEPEPRVILAGGFTGGGLATNPAFSPDSESVVFYNDGALKRMSIAGGSPVTLAESSNPFGVSWEDDGTIIYAVGNRVMQVPENGGEPETLIELEADLSIQAPQRLPVGDWILYAVVNETGSPTSRIGQSQIVIESPSTGERRVLRLNATTARYVPTGHLVYAEGGVLYALRFDIARLEPSGAPVPIVQGVRSTLTGLYQLDIAETGHLVYIPGPVGMARLEVDIATANEAGATTRIDLQAGAYVHVRASPDGDYLAIDTDDLEDNAAIWIHQLDGTSAMRRLTFEGNNRFPVWSPDGERLAFQSDRDGAAAIYVQPIDGSVGVKRLTTPEDGEIHVPESWSPSGGHLSFMARRGDTNTLWILSLEDGTVSRFGSVESTEPIGSVFSPDGRWLAYHSLPPGASATNTSSGIYVEPFPATGARFQAPKVVRDFHPVWSADGSALHYIGSASQAQIVTVDVNTEPTFSFSTPVLTRFTLTGERLSGATRAFDVLPGGGFVGPVRTSEPGASEISFVDTTASELRVVLNWFEELERLAPVQ